MAFAKFMPPEEEYSPPSKGQGLNNGFVVTYVIPETRLSQSFKQNSVLAQIAEFMGLWWEEAQTEEKGLLKRDTPTLIVDVKGGGIDIITWKITVD